MDTMGGAHSMFVMGNSSMSSAILIKLYANADTLYILLDTAESELPLEGKENTLNYLLYTNLYTIIVLILYDN